MPQSLSFAIKKASGRKGGVVYLFYFAAFILCFKKSVLGIFSESPNNNIMVTSFLPSFPSASDYSCPLFYAVESFLPDGRFTIKSRANILYNDLPDREANLRNLG